MVLLHLACHHRHHHRNNGLLARPSYLHVSHVLRSHRHRGPSLPNLPPALTISNNPPAAHPVRPHLWFHSILTAPIRPCCAGCRARATSRRRCSAASHCTDGGISNSYAPFPVQGSAFHTFTLHCRGWGDCRDCLRTMLTPGLLAMHAFPSVCTWTGGAQRSSSGQHRGSGGCKRGSGRGSKKSPERSLISDGGRKLSRCG